MQKDIYPIASLENTEAVNLEKAFYNIDGVNIVDKSAAMQIPDYANNNGISTNNSQVTETNMSQRLYRLNGNVPGSKMGLGITLKVMAGDQVDIMAKSYWKTADGNVAGTPSAIDLEGLLTNFVGNGIANKQGITGPLLNSAGGITSMLNELLNGQSQTSTRPKAYLNWILFDENFRPVTGSGHTNSGFDAVGANGELKPHSKSTGEITKNGYLYIYCSNESRLDVFFDNLQVVHTRGALLEETHYYPFGLTMAGISSKAFKLNYLENKYKFNDGTELNSSFDINLYETNFRSLDPQIGRFWQVDPMSHVVNETSPYVYANNNPLTFNDPLGLLSDSTKPRELAQVTVTAKRKVPDEYLRYLNFPNGRAYSVASARDWPISLSRDRSNDLLDSWGFGLGAENRVYLPYHPMTKRLKNAYAIKEAKAFFYKKYMKDYKSGQPLKNASVTDFVGSFGLTGLVLAGTDIVEQFVGSMTIDMFTDEAGENVLFVASNTTSNTSAFYHMADSHDRDPNREFDARGNLNQKYIWKVPLSQVMSEGAATSRYKQSEPTMYMK